MTMARMSDLRDRDQEKARGLEFWKRYDNLKAEHNTTDDWVARDSQFKANHIRAWRARAFIPRADYVQHIAERFGRTCEYLLSGADPKRISDSESVFLERAKRYTPVIEGLDVMDPICRSALTRAIVDIAAPRQSAPPGYQREASDQPVIGDSPHQTHFEESAAR